MTNILNPRLDLGRVRLTHDVDQAVILGAALGGWRQALLNRRARQLEDGRTDLPAYTITRRTLGKLITGLEAINPETAPSLSYHAPDYGREEAVALAGRIRGELTGFQRLIDIPPPRAQASWELSEIEYDPTA